MGIDLSIPDHTTLSRRGQLLDITLRRVPTGGGCHLIVDSSGLSIMGEGEWARAKYGVRGTRGWKKLHIAVDRSGVIVAETLTKGHVDDATTALRLIDAVDGDIAASPRTGPTTRSPSTMPLLRVARPSWCLRPTRTRCLGADPGQLLAIARSRRRGRPDGVGGRRRRATIGRPAWRTYSSGTSRSSGTAFERAVRRGRGRRPSWHATFSIR